MHKRQIPFIFLFLPLIFVIFIPPVAPVLGMATLLFSLALSIYTIFKKHKGTKNARPKILKEVGAMVLTLILIIFLGGTAAMLANYQVGIWWGEIAGLVSAIAASFMVGYLVRKGVTKFVG